MFNSALAYELTTLKPLVEPLLRQVPIGTREVHEAKRLLKFLEWFLPTVTEYVPDNSILREFIGGSILTDFSLWNQQGSIRPSIKVKDTGIGKPVRGNTLRIGSL
jgi:uridine kinase